MKTKIIWNALNTLLLIGLIVFFLTKKEEENVIFIDNVEVFQEFNMTKELGKINEEKYKPQLQQFDSLVKVFSSLEEKLSAKPKISKKERVEYENFKKQILLYDQEIQQLRVEVKQEINKQVWERLNTYVKEFGKENNASLILGAQGQGNVMYGNEVVNKTKEFLEFANLKYEGN